MPKISADVWFSLLILFLSAVPLADAAEQQSISSDNSAYAAGLSPEKIAELVAAPFLKQEKFPPGYITDIQLQALLALDDATGQSAHLEFVRKVAAEKPVDYSVQNYKRQMFSNIWFELFKRDKNPAFIEPFLAESRRYRMETPVNDHHAVAAIFSAASQILLERNDRHGDVKKVSIDSATIRAAFCR